MQGDEIMEETEKNEQTEVQDGVVKPEVNIEDINPEESVEAERGLEEAQKKQEEDTKGASEGILAKIKRKLTGETKEETSDVGDGIPDEFTEAARAVLDEGGNRVWTDEEIVKFASDYTDEQLLEIIPHLAKETKKEVKEKETDKTDDKKNETSTKDADRIKSLEEKILTLENRLSAEDKTKEKNMVAEQVRFANDFFDGLSDDVFGKTEDLKRFPDGRFVPTSPEYKARSQVWDDAALLSAAGVPFDRALKKAYNAYRGENLEKDATRKVIKDLRKNEKRLSADRYNKATEKTYTDDVERREDVVRNLAEEAGVKLD